MTSGQSHLLTGDPNKPTPCSHRAAGRIKDEGCARLCYFRAGLCTCKACFYLLSLSEPSCGPRRGQGREGQQHRHKLAKPHPWTCLINSECLKIFFKEFSHQHLKIRRFHVKIRFLASLGKLKLGNLSMLPAWQQSAGAKQWLLP